MNYISMTELGTKSKRLYQFNLDDECEKIIKTVPKMERSAHIRNLIKNSVTKPVPVVRIKL